MNLQNKIIYFSIIFFAFLLFRVNTSYAQEASLTINPPVLEVIAKPGAEVIVALGIENNGDPALVSTEARPFIPGKNSKEIILLDKDEAQLNISIERSNSNAGKSFFLPRKRGEKLRIKIAIPEYTAQADYYYLITISTQPGPGAHTDSGVSVKTSVGIPLLVSVTADGTLYPAPQINSINLTPRFTFSLFGRKLNFVDSGDPIPASVVFSNSGQHRIKPTGTITLTGNFGERASFDIIPLNVLAGSTRILQTTQTPPDSETSLVLSGFFVGRYNLTTTIGLGASAGQITKSITFYALPINVTISTLIAIAVVLVLKRKKSRS